MADKTPTSRPNSGEGLFKELIRKLEGGERVNLDSLSAEVLRRYGILNLAIEKNKDTTKIRSGGFEIRIRGNSVEVYKEKRVEVNGKIVYVVDSPIHVYTSGCLVKNFEKLLSELLTEYNYKVVDSKWITVKLPRSDRRVRQLQSWLLAVINGFDRPMHDSPLNC